MKFRITAKNTGETLEYEASWVSTETQMIQHHLDEQGIDIADGMTEQEDMEMWEAALDVETDFAAKDAAIADAAAETAAAELDAFECATAHLTEEQKTLARRNFNTGGTAWALALEKPGAAIRKMQNAARRHDSGYDLISKAGMTEDQVADIRAAFTA